MSKPSHYFSSFNEIRWHHYLHNLPTAKPLAVVLIYLLDCIENVMSNYKIEHYFIMLWTQEWKATQQDQKW